MGIKPGYILLISIMACGRAGAAPYQGRVVESVTGWESIRSGSACKAHPGIRFARVRIPGQTFTWSWYEAGSPAQSPGPA